MLLRKTTFHRSYHQILDPHICECPAEHNPVVSSSRSVGVEVLRLDAVRLKIDSGRRIRFYRTGRRNMIGRYRITEYRQGSRGIKVRKTTRFHRKAVEIRRL